MKNLQWRCSRSQSSSKRTRGTHIRQRTRRRKSPQLIRQPVTPPFPISFTRWPNSSMPRYKHLPVSSPRSRIISYHQTFSSPPPTKIKQALVPSTHPLAYPVVSAVWETTRCDLVWSPKTTKEPERSRWTEEDTLPFPLASRFLEELSGISRCKNELT